MPETNAIVPQDGEAAPPREVDKISELADVVPSLPSPQTWIEWAGTLMMAAVLAIICLAVVFFALAWWCTQPSIDDAKALLTPPQNQQPLDGDKVLDVWTKLHNAHKENFSEAFQLLIMTALVPLFTLLAGYVFGKGQARAPKQGDDG